MALLTKKELAERTGLKTKHVSTYIDRKKIIVTPGGMIDDADPMNAAFIQSQADKKSGTSAPVAKATPAEKKAAKKKEAGQQKEKNSLYELEKERKSVDLNMKKNQAALTAIEVEKRRGKLIPTDLVRNLMSQHSRSITISFSQFIDNFLVEIAKRAKLNVNQIAEIRGEMGSMLNRSVDQAVDMTAQSVKTMVAEYAKTRES